MRTFVGSAILAGIAVTGCAEKMTPPPAPEPLVVSNKFVEYLSEQGYVISPLPTSLDAAGSLVRIKQTDGGKELEWVSDLELCGVPSDVLYGKDNKLRYGVIPTYVLEGGNDFGFNVLAEIPKVTAEAGLSGEYAQIVDVQSAGVERVDRLGTANFLSDPLKRDKVAPHCLDAIEEGDAAILVDTVYIDTGEVQLVRKTGAKAALSVDEIKKVVNINADAHANFEQNGLVKFGDGTEKPKIFVALKDAFFVPETGTLAGGASKIKDATSEVVGALSGSGYN